MKHIDVFIMYKYGHKIFPELKPNIVSMVLTQAYEMPFSVERLEDYFNHPSLIPKTKYIVKALHDKGIQPKTIAEWLGVNQSTVSYHLSKEIKRSYYNRRLGKDEDDFHYMIQEMYDNNY